MHPIRNEIIQSISKDKVLKPKGEKGAPMTHAAESFALKTFQGTSMEKYLSHAARASLLEAAKSGEKINSELANEVAKAVKNWAVKNGATHFTHWFQPMTGATAEKHDSFLSLAEDGSAIEKLSGSQLIQSEPDASSFPSGGTRCTFEARGYTAWDPTSPMFLVENGGCRFLCIPSLFVSYTGLSLDKKTGLMRSIEAVNQASQNLLSHLGAKGIDKVFPTVGCEQEYFLVDQRFVNHRPDLLLCGRTVLGSDPIKGQQLEDQYFGAIHSRVQAYMADVEKELYELGVPIKTRHNEVAPGQYEMAPLFEEANLACDHQMLTMEIMKKKALQHGFCCLIHEKPFAGVNGSGKHINWSLATTDGQNLLDPGKTPQSNLRFLAFLSCVLDAVQNSQVAMRTAIASHGNDHRLGANEAPPAIFSVFLGKELSNIIESLESGNDISKIPEEKAFIDFGLKGLPVLPKDSTDRNRTSPFAFTGNKFEIRAAGSSQSAAFPVTMINSAMAKSLNEFSEVLQAKLSEASSLGSAILSTVKFFSSRSKAIRFEGDNYSEAWRKEAKSRGLKELLTTPEAWEEFSKKEHHQFLIDTNVLNEEEITARVNVHLDQYIKNIEIEARTLCSLAGQSVLPALQKQLTLCSSALSGMQELKISEKDYFSQKEQLLKIVALCEKISHESSALVKAQKELHSSPSELECAKSLAKLILPKMNSLRDLCAEAEDSVADEYWSLPKYREMLFIR